MRELELMAEVLAGYIENNMKELRAIDVREYPLKYEHKLGEIEAYNDTLNMVMWRINALRGNVSVKKGDK